MNLIYLADNAQICETIAPIMSLIGIFIKIMWIAVPVILIVVGIVKLSTAVASQDDKVIKDAQSSLIKKLVVAICVFLVIPIVTGVMSLVGNDDVKDCMTCINDPFNGTYDTAEGTETCGVIKNN